MYLRQSMQILTGPTKGVSQSNAMIKRLENPDHQSPGKAVRAGRDTGRRTLRQ